MIRGELQKMTLVIPNEICGPRFGLFCYFPKMGGPQSQTQKYCYYSPYRKGPRTVEDHKVEWNEGQGLSPGTTG